MANCGLTPTGRRVVQEMADIVRDGGSVYTTTRGASDAGLEVIGEGQTRAVFAETDKSPPRVFEGEQCVVKLAKNPGFEQNRVEVENWQEAPPDVREHLAPIHGWADDFAWVVMARSESDAEPIDVVRLEDRLDEAGVSIRGLHDENIGVIDGEPVVLDYGFPIKTTSGQVLAVPGRREWP